MDDEDDAEAMRRSGLLTLSTSIGLYVEEESLESSADAPDTDTDEGHELTLEEAHHNLRKLHIMRDHSAPEEFFSLLHATLVAVPLQFVATDTAVIKAAATLVPQVLRFVLDDALRRLDACDCLALLTRNRACARHVFSHVHELLPLLYRVGDVIEPLPVPLVTPLPVTVSPGARFAILETLRHLIASRACRAALVDAGGLEALLFALSDPASSVDSKASAVVALRRCCKSTNARELLAEMTGAEALANFFFELPIGHPAQKGLAGLLQTLATNSDVKVQLAAANVIPRFVEQLSIKHLPVLKYVICIVRNLACNNDENRRAVAAAGGIQRLLELMPLVNVKLQQKVAGALQNLATNRENRVEISQCGGVKVLIALIKTPDQKLQKYGLGGLKRLVYNSRESTQEFVSLGGLVPLVELLDSNDVSVLKNAVHALNRIRHYIGREPIDRIGGLGAIARLLTSEHEKIRALARRNLLSMNEDVGHWLRRIDAVAVRLLVAARVLLNVHQFVDPAEARALEVSRGGRSTLRMSVTALQTRARSRGDMSRRDAASAAPGSPGGGGSTADDAPAPTSSAAAAAAAAAAAPPTASGEGFHHDRALCRQLGFGDTYWDLRAFTQHMLPLPLLELILDQIDSDFLLTRSQRRVIFVWARDRSTLGLPMAAFLAKVTNLAPVSSEDEEMEPMRRTASCSLQ